MKQPLLIEPLDPTHERSRHDCGHEALNTYLHTGLDRDVGRYGCVAYMATLGDRNVVGFYTLSNALVQKHRLARSLQATGFSYQPGPDAADETGLVDPLPVRASPSLLRAPYETITAIEFQPGDAMPVVVALLEFVNAIDPSLIAALDLPEGATPFETAQALIAELKEGDLLDPGVAANVAALIESGDDPPPGLLEVLWIDLVTGNTDLEAVFAAAIEAAIASGSLRPEDAETLLSKMPGTLSDTMYYPEHELGRFLLDLQDVLGVIGASGVPVLSLFEADLETIRRAVESGAKQLEGYEGPGAVVTPEVVTGLDNPAVAAIIAYLNLLDRDLVAELEAPGLDDGALAVALLDRLLAAGVIEPAVHAAMLAVAIDPDGELDRDLLALFVLDVATGTEPLVDVLERLGLSVSADGTLDLAAVLLEFEILGGAVDAAIATELPGLRIPAADASGSVSSGGCTTTVLDILEDADAVATIRDRYRSAISPIAEGSLSDQR